MTPQTCATCVLRLPVGLCGLTWAGALLDTPACAYLARRSIDCPTCTAPDAGLVEWDVAARQAWSSCRSCGARVALPGIPYRRTSVPRVLWPGERSALAWYQEARERLESAPLASAEGRARVDDFLLGIRRQGGPSPTREDALCALADIAACLPDDPIRRAAILLACGESWSQRELAARLDVGRVSIRRLIGEGLAEMRGAMRMRGLLS